MFLKQINGNHLVEIIDTQELFNPMHETVMGRCHYGEEIQDAESFRKDDLIFPSGETLPKCWNDASLRHQQHKRVANG